MATGKKLNDMTQEAIHIGRQQGRVEAAISVLQLVFGHDAVDTAVVWFLPEVCKRQQRSEPLFHPDVKQSAYYLPAGAKHSAKKTVGGGVIGDRVYQKKSPETVPQKKSPERGFNVVPRRPAENDAVVEQ